MALETFANNAQTTLAAGISATDTTITVAPGGGFPTSGRFRIQIDNERMLVTAGAGTTTWAVQRAVEDASRFPAVTHASGSTVLAIVSAGGLMAAASAGMYIANVRDYGAKGDGTTDDSQAFADAQASIPSVGGELLVPPGTYLVGPITLQNNQTLRGSGWTSRLKLKAAANADFVKNFTSTTAGQLDAQLTTIRDIYLDGNASAQTAGSSRGIFLSQGTIDAEPLADGRHLVQNVFVTNTAGTGVYVDASETRLVSVQVHMVAGRGFHIVRPASAYGCLASYTATQGFYILSNSVRVSNSKAMHCGKGISPATASGRGFVVQNVTSTGVSITNCEAFSCTDSGFVLDTTKDAIISGCIADSNGTVTAGSPGFDVWATTTSRVDGVALDRNIAGSTNRQGYAVRIRTSSSANRITVVHDGNVSGAVTGDSVDGNDISIGAQEGSQTLSTTASGGAGTNSVLFGVVDHPQWHSLADAKTDIDRQSAAGLKTIRFDLGWRWCETADNVYDTAGYVKQFEDTLDYIALKGMFPIVTVIECPAWANTPSASIFDMSSATTRQKFADFMGWIAARESARPNMVWEIWNEENDANFWTTGKNPAQYADLLIKSYPVIKAADPDCTVIVGGILYNDQTFLSDLYVNGAGNYFDGVGIHPYCKTYSPTTSFAVGNSERWFSFIDCINDHWATLSAHGQTNKRLYITEFGWSIGPNQFPVSESTAAGFMTSAVQTVRANSDKVAMAASYVMNDRDYAEFGLWNFTTGVAKLRWTNYVSEVATQSQVGTTSASLTPDPYKGGTIKTTLTSNTTVQNPVNAHIGATLEFLFRQDATGGRVVTWGSAYKAQWTPDTTANKRNSIDFEFDGSFWIQTGSSTGLPS